MEKENIITVDIEDFKDSQHVLDYIDDDFAIVNSLEGTPYSNDTIKLNCFLIAVCIEGCIQLDVNYRTYKLQAGELLLGLPNTIISHTMLSPKYKVRLAGFSTRFLQRIIKMEKENVEYCHSYPQQSGEVGWLFRYLLRNAGTASQGNGSRRQYGRFERRHQTGELHFAEVHGTVIEGQGYAPFGELFCQRALLYSEAFLESHQAGMWQDSVGFD